MLFVSSRVTLGADGMRADASIVLGSLLGYLHRIDWKDCGQSEAEEKADAQTFKKAFTPFNS